MRLFINNYFQETFCIVPICEKILPLVKLYFANVNPNVDVMSKQNIIIQESLGVGDFRKRIDVNALQLD